jgi:hypothetical protein
MAFSKLSAEAFTMGILSTITADELSAALAPVANVGVPRFDLTKITERLSEREVCELATEATGNTAQTVQGLIEGVIRQCGEMLSRDALAALNAVAWYHVPKLQERADELERGNRAD